MSTDTTRRSLLKAAPAAAVALAIPASATAVAADRSQWETALRNLRAAEGEHATYVANTLHRAQVAEEAFEKAHGLVHRLPNGKWSPFYYERRRKLLEQHGTAHCVPDHVHERSEALCEAMCDAQQAVVQTPAPDLPALRWKLDYLLALDHADDENGGSLACWAGFYVKQTLADIARLLPKGA